MESDALVCWGKNDDGQITVPIEILIGAKVQNSTTVRCGCSCVHVKLPTALIFLSRTLAVITDVKTVRSHIAHLPPSHFHWDGRPSLLGYRTLVASNLVPIIYYVGVATKEDSQVNQQTL